MRAPETSLTPFSNPDAEPTPWSVALDTIRRAQKFWLSTVRTDGRPHVTPLLATWSMDGMVFCTGANEQKSHNLEQNPRCVLTTGVNTLVGLDVVIEGEARLVTDDAGRESGAADLEAAYGWHLTRPDGTWHGMGDGVRSGEVQLFHTEPDKVFAIGNGEPFAQTRYRWR
jgi:hypothetical protein